MSIRVLALGAALAAVAAPSTAATVVVPNNRATTSGGTFNAGIFANRSSQNTTQIGIAASQLTGIAIGSTISSVGFRIATNQTGNTNPLVYTDYQIKLGSSAQPSVASLSANFAANYGADTTLVRSGALTIATGALVSGSTVNPFYMLNFDTGYVYQGGDLLLTIAYQTFDRATLDATIRNDAVASSSTEYAVQAQSGFYPSTGSQGVNAVVVQFGYAAAAAPMPEPASWAMMIAGLGFIGATLRRRRVVARTA